MPTKSRRPRERPSAHVVRDELILSLSDGGRLDGLGEAVSFDCRGKQRLVCSRGGLVASVSGAPATLLGAKRP